MQVIVVRMADQHEIDGWQVVDRYAGEARAFDDAVPHRPVGIDEHVHRFELDEKPGVADPGDADGFVVQRVELGTELIALTAFENAWNDLMAEEAVIALRPSFGGLEAGVFGAVGDRGVGHSGE